MENEDEFQPVGFNNGPLRDPKKLLAKSKELALELGDQQRQFCHAMLTAETATAAAIIAGYAQASARITASKLLKDPRIQEYIGILSLLRSQAIALDAAQIISLQLNTYYRAMEEGDIKAANTALDQLAKMNGLYSKVGKPNLEPEVQTKSQEIDEITKMANILSDAANRRTMDS